MTHLTRAAPSAAAALSRRRGTHGLFALLLGAALLCGIGAVNRGPFYFYDTIGYLRTASQGVERILGVRGAAPASPERDVAAPAPPTGEDANVKWANRSVWFGAVLAIADRIDAMALVVVAQGILAAWLLLLCWRRFGPGGGGPWALPALCLAMVVLTPLGFYVAYLMPDLLFGLVLLALPLLLLARARLSPSEIAGLLALAAFACLAHVAAVMFLGLMLVAGLVVTRLVARHRAGVAIPAALAAACVIGVLGNWAVGKVSERVFGQAALWPPFTLARVVADGPGTLYLREECARAPGRFALCRYLDALPPADSDVFLWDMEPGRGVLAVATNAEQRRMIREQWDVVVPAILAYPGLQLQASIGHALRQLVLVGVEEFAWEDRLRRQMSILFPSQLDDLDRTRVAGSTGGWWRPVNLLHLAVVAAALLVILARLAFGFWAPAEPGRARCEAAWLLILLGGVVLNAVLSGVLAEPHSRYGARIVWVLPLAAMLLAARRVVGSGTAIPRQ